MTEDWLREALPPVGDAELSRDLWADMTRRMVQRPQRVAWLDWALAGLAAAWLALFPEAIGSLLYHL